MFLHLHKLAILSIALGVACSRSTAQTSQPTSARGRTNVVIYLVDTLRADRLGVYGYHRRPTSPTLDALASESVVFDQAYAAAPWTLPSVASLFTSTFPCEHQLLEDSQRLSRTLPTLAERLKSAGYATVNLYSNEYAGRRFGLGRGFDVVRYFPTQRGARVGRTLRGVSQRPFFLYIHSIEPHHPQLFAPIHTNGFRDVSRAKRNAINEAYLAYRRATRKGKTKEGVDASEEQRRQMAVLNRMHADYSELYDAAVRAADTIIRAQINALKRRGAWDNTLFILVADHGEEMFEHGGWLHDQSVYEELMRVPLIIHFPQGRWGGRRLKSVVSLVDVFPTVMDYLGSPQLANGTRGESLMPLIKGERPDDPGLIRVAGMRINRKKFYRPWKEQRGDENIMIRQGKWKGIWNVEPDTIELYDLQADPAETHDLAAVRVNLATLFRGVAQTWRQECGKRAATPGAPAEQLDEKTKQRLRELGYID